MVEVVSVLEKELPQAQELLKTLSDLLSQHLHDRAIDLQGESAPKMVGIESGGVWIAQHLHKVLALPDPLGRLDISFYRDDFTQKGLHPNVKPTQLPFSVEGQIIILVDDVVMTGRTVRAALNELFDYGRPKAVILATLIDLGANQLPVRADVCGASLTLSAQQRIKLSGPSPLKLVLKHLDTGSA